MSDKLPFLDIFHDNRVAILEAARLGLAASVTGCPGWTVGVLIGHMGSVFTFWDKWIRERPRGSDEQARQELIEERSRELPGYAAWAESQFSADAVPSGVEDFARRMGDRLEEHLRALDPAEHVWTFFPPDQTAGFIRRRLAHETTIHRWDAEAAHQVERPVDARLAYDGIDEILSFVAARASGEARNAEDAPEWMGQRFRFVDDGSDRGWEIEFSPAGVRLGEGADPPRVTLTGSSSALLLFLWNRLPAASLHVDGDPELAGAWAALAGTF